MAPSKREREYARKRQAQWEERRRAKKERQRRIGVIVAILAIFALVAGGVIVAGLTSSEPEQSATPGTEAAAGACPPAATEERDGGDLPDPSTAEARTWTASVDLCVDGATETVELELDGGAAPQAVASFVSLADQGYFDGTSCHRLTTQGIYVLQCGDPTATGTGGPGYTYGPVENAPADDLYPAGTLAMARRGGDAASMGSQFFLVYEDSTIPSDAAGGYTVFGTVSSGLDTIQAVADAGTADGAGDGSPVSPVIIEGVETQ